MADPNSASEDIYAPWRTFDDSPRLALQQFLWRQHLGYNIYPSVTYPDPAAPKIADIATGTCLWLLQVSQELPASAQLMGSDISFAQTPPATALPRNVSIQMWDVFDPVLKDWIGSFDLVHVRLLYPSLRPGSTSGGKATASPVEIAHKLREILIECSTGLGMLNMANRRYHEEPGGYLQWGEYDLNGELLDHLAAEKTDDILETARSLYASICAMMGSDQLPWTAKLKDVFAEIGLQDIQVDDKPYDAIWSKYWQEHEMLIFKQTIDVVARRNKELADKLREQHRIVQTAKYQGKGYVTHLMPVVAVGRKPMQ